MTVAQAEMALMIIPLASVYSGTTATASIPTKKSGGVKPGMNGAFLPVIRFKDILQLREI
jgi:hypothetical protein